MEDGARSVIGDGLSRDFGNIIYRVSQLQYRKKRCLYKTECLGGFQFKS